MAAMMTEVELELVRVPAEEVESHDYESPRDTGDYISAVLYKTPEGCDFRLVTISISILENGWQPMRSDWTTFA